MKKVKVENIGVAEVKNEIQHFNMYTPKEKDGTPKGKGSMMVRIKGSFFAGGFNLSKNKVKAVLDNIELLTQFANGEFDKDIESLGEDEVLQP